MAKKDDIRHFTFYSETIDGDHENGGRAVTASVRNGYVEIEQCASEAEKRARILLSPDQWRMIEKFVKSPKRLPKFMKP